MLVHNISGLGALTLAAAITKQENTAVGLNNPGALTYAPSSFCQTGKVGNIVQFCTPQDGISALDNQIRIDTGNGLTLSQMLSKYAPAAAGNNPTVYTANASSWMGVDPNTQLAMLDPTQLYGSDIQIPVTGDTVGNDPTAGLNNVSYAGFGIPGFTLGTDATMGQLTGSDWLIVGGIVVLGGMILRKVLNI